MHQTTSQASVAGLLLTGGRSRRMGRDKASLVIGGETLAARSLAVLSQAASPVVEVGPGHTDAPCAVEPEPGQGPLAAVAAGGAWLRAQGHEGPAIVLAVDLPQVSAALLQVLVGHPAPGAVVPVVAGRPQPLCARWPASALAAAESLVAAGGRSMGALLDVADVTWLDENGWRHVASAEAFSDIDTPADLAAAIEPSGR